jgi:hypothetical protein
LIVGLDVLFTDNSFCHNMLVIGLDF